MFFRANLATNAGTTAPMAAALLRSLLAEPRLPVPPSSQPGR